MFRETTCEVLFTLDRDNMTSVEPVSKLTVESYENQRWYPVAGWRGKLLVTDRPHYSSEDGKEDRRRESIPLPPGFRWSNEWTQVPTKNLMEAATRNEQIDPDGWEYATDFRLSFSPNCSMGCCVRRRLWVRTMEKDTSRGVTSFVDDNELDLCDDNPRPASLAQAPLANQAPETEREDTFELPAGFAVGGRVQLTKEDTLRTEESTEGKAEFDAAFAAFLQKAKDDA